MRTSYSQPITERAAPTVLKTEILYSLMIGIQTDVNRNTILSLLPETNLIQVHYGKR